MESRSEGQWNPAAAVACWLVPGLGYALLGEWRRGLLVGTTILALWVSGLLVGGVSSVTLLMGSSPSRSGGTDVPDWFLAGLQPLIAPSLIVGKVHQRLKGSNPTPAEGSLYRPSFGRVSEIGMYYTAIAGMLNLLCMVDVVHREVKRKEGDE